MQMEVRQAVETPQKSRLQPPRYAYMTDQSIYSREDEAIMSSTVKDVFRQAEIWRDTGVHEAHWCTQVVSPLLNLVRRLGFNSADATEDKPGADILNM